MDPKVKELIVQAIYHEKGRVFMSLRRKVRLQALRQLLKSNPEIEAMLERIIHEQNLDEGFRKIEVKFNEALNAIKEL